MDNLNSRAFVGIYIDSVLEAIQADELLKLTEFYERVFGKVSTLTSLSGNQITNLHHAFHWALFIDENPYLELFMNKTNKDWGDEIKGINNGYLVRKKRKIEKASFEEYFLGKYGSWLEARLENLRQAQD